MLNNTYAFTNVQETMIFENSLRNMANGAMLAARACALFFFAFGAKNELWEKTLQTSISYTFLNRSDRFEQFSVYAWHTFCKVIVIWYGMYEWINFAG